MPSHASKEMTSDKLIHFLAVYSDKDNRMQTVTISAENIIDAVCLAKYQGGAHPAVGFYKLVAVMEKTKQAQIRAITQVAVSYKGKSTNA
jgi:hypothetical protein